MKPVSGRCVHFNAVVNEFVRERRGITHVGSITMRPPHDLEGVV